MSQINDKPMTGFPINLNFLVFQLFIISLVSCSETTNKNKSKGMTSPAQENVITKPPSSFTDTLIIDFPAAVFYNPDSIQLEKIKSNTDSMIFNSLTHEYFYQMKYSRQTIQQNWPGIKIIDISKMRYILFKLKSREEECIDLNTKNDFCGILLFDGKKKSKLADMTNIDSELGFYFSK